MTHSNDVVDNITQAIGNIVGSGFAIGDMFDALTGQQTQIADINAGLAALQADQAAGFNSGVSYQIRFSDLADGTVPSSLTKVTDTGAGGVSVIGGALKWSESGDSDASEVYIYTAGELATDYFEVSAVMPSRSEADWLYGAHGRLELIGRSNTAGTRYSFGYVTPYALRAGCSVDGARTDFGTEISYSVPAGAYVTFRGGTAGGNRVFQILVNNVVKFTGTDTGSVSYLGADYRRCGLGFYARARSLGGQNSPASVSIMTMNDNTPAPIMGTTFRAYRGTTTAINASSNTVLPNGCMDTIDYISGDLTWNSANQKLTVSKAGTYIVGIRIKCFNTIATNETWAPLLYKQGALQSRGSGDTGMAIDVDLSNNAFPVQKLKFFGGAPMMVYLAANEYIQFGISCSSTQGIVGNSAGTETWVTVVRVG